MAAKIPRRVNLPRWFYTGGWISLGVMAALLEGLALADPKPMDTLSENIWWLLGLHPLVWFVGAGLSVWAWRHLFWKKP